MEEPTKEEIEKVLPYLFNPSQTEWDITINDKVYVIHKELRTPIELNYRVFVFDKEES